MARPCGTAHTESSANVRWRTDTAEATVYGAPWVFLFIRSSNEPQSSHFRRYLPVNGHRNYVVDNWRCHNLRAPPQGYQWVQSGGDYILIAIATGIIADLLLSHS